MIDGLDVSGRRVVVCGGHAAALSVITRLRAEGALITVIAGSVATTLRDLAERDELTWEERAHQADDVAHAALVVAATGTELGDAAVSALAEEHNCPAIRTTLVREFAPPGIGRVILVGGGPGDPGLLTVAGLEAIRVADVIVCDRLAPLEALREARPGTEIIDVAKIPRGTHTSQERINELLIEHAGAGRVVVRLKGGDNFVFGRGGEEWQACAAAGLPVEVVPGVSAALAAPALAGIPLTHRQLTQGFTVVSGHLPPGDPGSTLDWASAGPRQHQPGDHDGRGDLAGDHGRTPPARARPCDSRRHRRPRRPARAADRAGNSRRHRRADPRGGGSTTGGDRDRRRRRLRSASLTRGRMLSDISGGAGPG